MEPVFNTRTDRMILQLMDRLEAQFETMTEATAPMADAVFFEAFHARLVELEVKDADTIAENMEIDICGLNMEVDNDRAKVEYFGRRWADFIKKALESKAFEKLSPIARRRALRQTKFRYQG